MRRLRRPTSFKPLWLFAAALLLRAAMPFLAEASAELQGRSLGEVCSVHGISLVPSGAPHPDAPVPGEQAGAAHCALQALAMLGTAAPPPAPSFARPAEGAARVAVAPPTPRPDAAARWIALRKHGPPRTA